MQTRFDETNEANDSNTQAVLNISYRTEGLLLKLNIKSYEADQICTPACIFLCKPIIHKIHL